MSSVVQQPWNLSVMHVAQEGTDKQEESRGKAGNKPPPPNPSGHREFYTQPLISITITVNRPLA